MLHKTLGRTELKVSIVGLGTAHLGLPSQEAMFTQHVEHPDRSIMDFELGVRTVHAALEAGATLIDTAPKYGAGMSEQIVAEALRRRLDLANNCVITTKVGCVHPGDGFDHSYDAAMRSVEGSMRRFGRERFPVLYLHDPMGYPIDFVMSDRGTMGALRRLREEGVAQNIGVAANNPETAADYIETGEFDAAIVAGGWSLINQIASRRILPAAERENVGIVVATPIERGLLVTGPMVGLRYLERHFSPACQGQVLKMKDVCDKFRVPLAAAALQWCSRHPQVTTAIAGARTPEEAKGNTLAGTVAIPPELWSELDPLVEHWESYKAP